MKKSVVKKMKIVFFETDSSDKRYLTKKFKDINSDLVFIKEPLSESNFSLAKGADIISVFIYSKLNKDVLSKILKISKLKFISTRSTGFDHIDINFCKKNNILVSNVPYYGANTVAEHTFALILSLSRKVHKSYVRTLREDFSIDGLVGFDLKGKTIGVVGGGQIGLHVARIASGFGMKVLVYDLYRQEFLSEVMNFSYVDLDRLFKESDIVSLHLPYTPSTHHIIDKDAISKMKKGVILINTARGALVNTDDLLEAIESGKVSGAGLDVLEGEKLIKEEKRLLDKNKSAKEWEELVRNMKILNHDNVVFTPHNAFNSKEALLRILDTSFLNIKCFLENKSKNILNK